MRNIRFQKIKKEVLKGQGGFSFPFLNTDNKYPTTDLVVQALSRNRNKQKLIDNIQTDFINDPLFEINQNQNYLQDQNFDETIKNQYKIYNEESPEQQHLNWLQKSGELDKLFKSLENEEDTLEDPSFYDDNKLPGDNNQSTGEQIIFSKGNGGFSNLKPIDKTKQQNWLQNVNIGLGLAQMGMYALGSNQNDSKGTTMMRGGIAAGAELASQLPPPANAAAPILKSINLADSIMDYAGVGPYNKTFQKDDYTFEKVGGSYGSTLAAANEASQLSGLRHGFLGLGGRRARNRDNAKINEANRQQTIMAQIANENDDLKNAAESMSDINHIHNTVMLNGGYDPRYSRLSAKEGGKLEIESFDDFLENYKEIESFDDFLTTYLKDGGKLESPNNIESDQNVIPEGALHKNKHNLKETGFDDSSITKKGIPVIDDEGNQQAEIELNEIIFSLEVSQFLEENYHKFYEAKGKEQDEIALNVGKELVYQILANTQDNTGLIEVAKEGTKLVLNNAQ